MNERDEQQIIQLLSEAATQRKGFELLVRGYSEQLYWIIRKIVIEHDDANDGHECDFYFLSKSFHFEMMLFRVVTCLFLLFLLLSVLCQSML